MSKSDIKSLEYWILKPFKSLNDQEQSYVKKIQPLLQSLTDCDLNTRDNILKELESHFCDNKMVYEYVDRNQIHKAINQMKSTVVSRIIQTQLAPVASKVVETVSPVVKKTWNETLSPAADKTLRFLYKTFAKKRIEVKEVESPVRIEEDK